MDKPVLVTGGLGFIGSAFIRRVTSGGGRVVNIDAHTYAASPARLADVAPDLLRTIRLRVEDESIAEIVTETRPRLVVHFAAESHVTRSETQEEAFMRANVDGTRSILEAARAAEVERVVHISTDEVYGPCLEGAFTESEKEPGPGHATSPYARSKALADDVAQGFLETIPLTIVRPTNCFGPWQHPEKAMARWVTRALAGRRLPVWGDGAQSRQWMHVDDASKGIEMLAEKGASGEIYNLGPDSSERTNLEAAELVARLTGAPGDSVYLTAYDRPQHDRRYAVDNSKAAALGWAPDRDFESGLAATVEWYRNHEAWWRPLIETAEALYADDEVRTR